MINLILAILKPFGYEYVPKNQCTLPFDTYPKLPELLDAYEKDNTRVNLYNYHREMRSHCPELTKKTVHIKVGSTILWVYEKNVFGFKKRVLRKIQNKINSQ